MREQCPRYWLASIFWIIANRLPESPSETDRQLIAKGVYTSMMRSEWIGIRGIKRLCKRFGVESPEDFWTYFITLPLEPLAIADLNKVPNLLQSRVGSGS